MSAARFPFVRACGLALAAAALLPGCGEPTAGRPAEPQSRTATAPAATRPDAAALSEAAWRKRLTPKEFHVLRERGTERAGSGALLHEKRPGVFRCAGCGQPLFRTADKFDSGTGWPSFTRPIGGNRVRVAIDTRHGMRRKEVRCARCGGHLGHVFADGPPPTGERYCINSVAMDFEPADTPAN